MLIKKQILFTSGLALVLVGFLVIHQASAQWQDPVGLPGGSIINKPLTNPLGESLDFNGYDITNVDDISADDVSSNQVCIAGDCQTAWPVGDVTNPMTSDLDANNNSISNLKSCDPAVFGGSTDCYALSGLAAQNNSVSNVTIGLYGATEAVGTKPNYAVFALSQNSSAVGLYGTATAGWAAYFNGPFGATGNGQIIGDLDLVYDSVGKVGGNLDVEVQVTSNKFCMKSSCITAWPTIGGSGTANYIPKMIAGTTLGNSVIYETGGKIGIGTTGPNKKLHVYDVAANAEIDIQSSATAASHWGLYHNASSDDLIFWKDAADRFTFTDDGKFGVGVTPSVSIQTGGDITASGNITASAFFYSSDANLKTKVKTITTPLDKVKNLRGVSFDWKKTSQPSLGFIAQEVEQVLPELVHESNGQKYLEYGNITAVLVEAIKAQQQQIEQLQAEVDQLKSK